MKLRIYQSSVRLRLSRSEVDRLARGEAIEDTLPLMPDCLTYRLAGSSEVMSPTANFEAGALRVMLPASSIQGWALTDQIGITATLPSNEPGFAAVQLVVEKDFECLHGAPEEQEDCFANPNVRL